MTIEDILLGFRAIRVGRVQLYGRLDTPTLMDALRRYDLEILCPIRETRHKRQGESFGEADPRFTELVRQIQSELPEPPLTYSDILKRRSIFTDEQRKEIAARDRQRATEAGT